MLPVFSKLTAQQEQTIRQTAANLNLPGLGNSHLDMCYGLAQGLYAALNNGTVVIPGLNADVWLSYCNHLEQQRDVVCLWCRGHGHETKDCMSNILLTRTARNAGVGFHWGALKGAAYYRAAENQITIQEHRENARKPKVTVKVIKKKPRKSG